MFPSGTTPGRTEGNRSPILGDYDVPPARSKGGSSAQRAQHLAVVLGVMGRFVALLRGINVGGKNIIPMKALAEFFVELGFDQVRTYIQSGNVVFDSRKGPRTLVPALEGALRERFRYQASVVVKSHADLKRVVAQAPAGFGQSPDAERYDVLFLMPALLAKDALSLIPRKEGVDHVFAGPGVLYFSRLIAKASETRLSRITQLPIYQQMTVRNWNTTTALLSMMDAP